MGTRLYQQNRPATMTQQVCVSTRFFMGGPFRKRHADRLTFAKRPDKANPKLHVHECTKYIITTCLVARFRVGTSHILI